MEHSPHDDARLDPAAGDIEEVDAVPVLSEAGAALEPRRPAGQVVVRQAAAVAATSFAAGVATVALARAHKDPARPAPGAPSAHGADRRVALVPRRRAPARPARLTRVRRRPTPVVNRAYDQGLNRCAEYPLARASAARESLLSSRQGAGDMAWRWLSELRMEAP